MTVELNQTPFGVTADGRQVDRFTFSHVSGVEMCVINYGGIVQSLVAPDRDGELADIVLGYDTMAEYESDIRFFGCVVGRYANRIANGRFSLNGVDYQLETNPTGHHLHGGSDGFSRQVWSASIDEDNGLPLLVLNHKSADGHGGYPGNLSCSVTYALNKEAEVEVNYYASSDQPTVVNLTNHSYFNLSGHHAASEDSILSHLAVFNCDHYLPTDDKGIPLSEPVSVEGTPMDFRAEKSFGEHIHDTHPQLAAGAGYDHNWVINSGNGSPDLVMAARITDPKSGRTLEVVTTQPGIQCYTANKLDGLKGKGGAIYGCRGAVCLETQHFPDSPNRSEFPSTVVTPASPLHEIAVFKVN